MHHFHKGVKPKNWDITKHFTKDAKYHVANDLYDDDNSKSKHCHNMPWEEEIKE